MCGQAAIDSTRRALDGTLPPNDGVAAAAAAGAAVSGGVDGGGDATGAGVADALGVVAIEWAQIERPNARGPTALYVADCACLAHMRHGLAFVPLPAVYAIACRLCHGLAFVP